MSGNKSTLPPKKPSARPERRNTILPPRRESNLPGKRGKLRLVPKKGTPEEKGKK